MRSANCAHTCQLSPAVLVSAKSKYGETLSEELFPPGKRRICLRAASAVDTRSDRINSPIMSACFKSRAYGALLEAFPIRYLPCVNLEVFNLQISDFW